MSTLNLSRSISWWTLTLETKIYPNDIRLNVERVMNIIPNFVFLAILRSQDQLEIRLTSATGQLSRVKYNGRWSAARQYFVAPPFRHHSIYLRSNFWAF